MPKNMTTEHQEQVMLFKYMEFKPELQFAFAIPNGGHRHIAVARKLKAEGVKSGVPDIFIPLPRAHFHGIFIEMKTRTGKLSKNQNTWLEYLHNQGFYCCVAHGVQEAIEDIEKYLKL